jgi:aerobic-type carbon monoxide dehydrogenase small subunit (CoxS/CutS family)
MGHDEKSNAFSRRSFIKGVGAGLVGGAALASGTSATPQEGAAAGKAGAGGEGARHLALEVNGRKVEVRVEPQTTLAELLRGELGLTGTKTACNRGECGACTVLLDGMAVYSCQLLALDAEGRKVVTIEGLLEGEELHPVQEAFIEHDGFQCGFCTPGQVMAAQALLLKHKKPTRGQVLEGMSGNLCRCGAYPNIIDSVLAAADKANR